MGFATGAGIAVSMERSDCTFNLLHVIQEYLALACVYIGMYNVCMPRVTVYIRQADLEAWQSIENKSQWIHERLGGGEDSGTDMSSLDRLVRQRVQEEINKREQEYGY